MNITQAFILLLLLLVLNSFYSYSFIKKNNFQNHAQQSKITESNNETSFTPAMKYFGTAIFLLPLLGGLWGVNHWFKDYNLAKSTIHWNKTTGTIISKSIDGNVISNHSTQVISSNQTYYAPKVVYQFSIDGDTYESSNIDYNSHPAYGDKSKVEMILSELPEAGETTTVYVNSDISKSVLTPGTQNMSYFGILASLPFLIAGFMGMKFLYKF